jgi:streptogramin lyase
MDWGLPFPPGPDPPLTTRSPLLSCLALCVLGPALIASEFPASHLFVGVQGKDHIQVYGKKGELKGTIGASSALSDPTDLAFGPGGLLYALSAGSDDVQVFDPDGQPVLSFGASAGLSAPCGIVFGPDGSLFVGDGGSQSIFCFSRIGVLVDTIGAGSGMGTPCAPAFSSDGYLLVASSDVGMLHEFDPSGVLLDKRGGSSGLARAGGMALGANGHAYVSSPATHSIMVLDSDGVLVDEIGKGTKLEKQSAVLSIQPGGQSLTLQFLGDDDDQADSLQDIFGSDAIVLPGTESFRNGDSKKRRFHGEWIPAEAASQGVATLSILVGGKVDKRGNFAPKVAKGVFLAAGPDLVFIGSGKAGKRLK